MKELVEFREKRDGGARSQKRALTYWIDPDHVALVIPRRTYTTLLVGGRWLHVAHPYQDVVRMLGGPAKYQVGP